MMRQGRSLDPHKKNAKPVLSESGYRSHTPMKCSVVYSNQNKVHVDHAVKRFCHIDFGKSLSPLGTVHKEQGNLQLWHKKFLTSSRDVGTISQ